MRCHSRVSRGSIVGLSMRSGTNFKAKFWKFQGKVELENAKAAERGWELQAEHGFKQLKQLEGQNQKLKNKLETLGVKSV